MLSVIEENTNGKTYRLPSDIEQKTITQEGIITERNTELLPKAFTGGSVIAWGLTKWSELFSNRQYAFLDIMHKKMNELLTEIQFEAEYSTALITFLGVFLDRLLPVNTSFGRWAVGRETVTPPFSKQAIPFVFDYPESNPFCNSTGSALNQLDWITRYIESECGVEFSTNLTNASSGEKNQFAVKSITAVITDPPYYDAIAYADLSDFFYCWLKKSLGAIYPDNFAMPQTPKSEECTALKHHHDDDKSIAKKHFEDKLIQIFDAIELQTTDIVSIMFAHQSTEAWSTLCNSILGARMNITGSWAIDTEMTNRTLALSSAALTSSVTVSCIPSQRAGYGEYKKVKAAIEKRVLIEVDELYGLGFRGADLLTACFGQAVSEFGKYEKVEKADGSSVTIAELLEMSRESAFNALLKGFNGDDFSKFYIGWLQLNGFADTDFDDAAKFTKVGLSINVQDLFKDHILIKNGNKQKLGSLTERLKENQKLGEGKNNHLIDIAHRLMYLYSSPNRALLLKYIDANASDAESMVWRVVTSLAELLPKDIEDYKLATGLLTNKEQLIRESKNTTAPKAEQTRLTFE
jgi:adenine-specific DNA methylase